MSGEYDPSDMELIGRQEQLADLRSRLRSGRRLVTVVGPGGVGKTALAEVVIEELAPAFALGAHRVDLSRIDRPDAVGGALAAQLGFASFETLLESPADQAALLLVDNCEHVLDAAAEAIATLLERCPSPTVLATSRSPLDQPNESVVALSPLPVPDPGSGGSTAAVELFCERARDAGVDIDDSELALVGELCRRLDGLPLALEIAAARCRSLGIADILAQLESGIDIIARPTFRGVPRHRSLHETIAWSYDLLDEDAQVAFDRLGVCAGPFTLDLAGDLITGVGGSTAGAADGRVGDARTLAVIERLLAVSLLVAMRSGDGMRYRMLESVRAVAIAHLETSGELDVAQDLFTAHVQRLVAGLIEESRGVWDARMLPDLLEHFDAVDAAIRHTVEVDGRPDRALMMYAVLWGALWQGRVQDVVGLGLLIQEHGPQPDAPYAPEAAGTLAAGLLLRGEQGRAVALAHQTLAGVGVSPLAGTMLRRVLGRAARADGDHHLAARVHREAAAMAHTMGIGPLEAECMVLLGQDLARVGDTDEALALVRSAAALARAEGSPLDELRARTAEAAILIALGDSGARAASAAALALAEACDQPYEIQALAWTQLRGGSPTAAAPLVLRVLDSAGRVGADRIHSALALAAATLRAAGRDSWRRVEAAAAADHVHRQGERSGAAEAIEVTTASRIEAIRVARQELAAMMDAAPGRADESAPVAPNVLRRTGAVWEVAFGGTTVHVKDAKGVRDLATLLRRPGTEVSCLDLASAGVVEADVGETIDAQARRAYENRVRELQADIDEAEADNDLGRADASRLELDAIIDHLTAALGLGHRARSQGGTAARARSAVTHRLRAAIARIGELHPELGRHLDRSVRTGTACVYAPEPSVTWQVEDG